MQIDKKDCDSFDGGLFALLENWGIFCGFLGGLMILI
jgi:hypothetical protein